VLLLHYCPVVVWLWLKDIDKNIIHQPHVSNRSHPPRKFETWGSWWFQWSFMKNKSKGNMISLCASKKYSSWNDPWNPHVSNFLGGWDRFETWGSLFWILDNANQVVCPRPNSDRIRNYVNKWS